jgi:septum formation protein
MAPGTPLGPRLVLASASVGRRNLLLASGIRATIIVSDVDEREVEQSSGLPSDDAEAVTLLLARAKAQDVAARILAGEIPAEAKADLGGPPSPDTPVLVVAADSMLLFAGRTLGKADDAQEVRTRWAAFAGQWADLVTGHVVVELPSRRTVSAAITTRIRAGLPTPQELEDYIASGEPLQVAGSATIDGLGAAFLAGIDGDPSNVVGLSLPNLRLLLAELGVRWTSLWDPQLTRPTGSPPDWLPGQ